MGKVIVKAGKTGIRSLHRVAVFFLALLFIPAAARGENVVLKDGRVYEGEIVSVENGRVWIKRGSGRKGIGIRNIERIVRDDGTVSVYDHKAAVAAIERSIRFRDYAGARALCDSLLAYYPESSQAYYLRAVINQKTGATALAMADYSLLIERGTADARVFNNLAVLYAQKPDPARARELFVRATQADPDFAEAHQNLADLCMRTQDHALAMEEYTRVVSLEPDNTRALYNLGVLHAQKGDHARARQEWEQVLFIDPKDADAKKALELARGSP